MPSITIKNFRVKSDNTSDVTFEVKWKTTFRGREVASHTVFNFEVFLQNQDGIGDPDVRRKSVVEGWIAAQDTPLERTDTFTASRSFLNEDFQFIGIGDTTDEWNAEVILRPFRPRPETKAVTTSGQTIREEFQLP
jgi:hypothetical protein